MPNHELAFTPAHALAKLVARKKLSPVELTRLYLKRIEELNPKLNAYLTITADEAMASARGAEQVVMDGGELGPLHAVPISIKDLETTAGIRTTFGSLIYKDYVPDCDSPVVQRVRKSGAIILGKTNTPEFGGLGDSTANRLGDPCCNPWDTNRSPGGSSGGAGAAVAAGLCPLATGSDSGGSIRIPASYCGVYGILPAFEPRVGGVVTPDLDPLLQPGPLARCVTDAALFLQVLAGPDAEDAELSRPQHPDYLTDLETGVKGLRIAWSLDLGFATVDPEVAKITYEAAKVFEELGAAVEETEMVIEDAFNRLNTIHLANFYADYGHFLEDRPQDLTDYIRQALEQGKQVTGADYARAMRDLMQIRSQMDTLMDTHDLLLTPTAAVPAIPMGKPPTTIAGHQVESYWGAWPFTYIFNMTRQPAASVPCGFSSDGLPIGLHVIGRQGDQATVLRASYAFERVRPWADIHPPIS